VASPDPIALAELAAEAGIPYLYDVGSGLLADLSAWGLTSEPRVVDALAAGAGLVLFSGDKLLGGPQAGCIVGRRDLVAPCVQNPLARALRADKLTLAALEATLALYDDPENAVTSIPVLRMLTLEPEVLAGRARHLAAVCPAVLRPEIQSGESAVGGGAFPGATLPTTLVALDPGTLGPDGLALRLRVGEPPIITRVQGGRVLLDPRTLDEDCYATIGRALTLALVE
jgi:L-seryl-tRNA(Ser) seleniumtransferase